MGTDACVVLGGLDYERVDEEFVLFFRHYCCGEIIDCRALAYKSG